MGVLGVMHSILNGIFQEKKKYHMVIFKGFRVLRKINFINFVSF